jgi:dihydroorotate dehydrogenase electron transfer subunit
MNTEAELTELVLGYGGWLESRPPLTPRPGQYVIASPLGSPATLPEALFPAAYAVRAWLAADPLPAAWQPGLLLSLRGPLGNGFTLPGTARRVALAAPQTAIQRLLPLVELALGQGAAVTLCTADTPPGLPSAVEVLPPEALPELAAWADYLALELPVASLEGLRPRLGLERDAHPAAKIEVLVRIAMPCGGLGECGICAVPVRKGWLPACTHGPVFDLMDLV